MGWWCGTPEYEVHGRILANNATYDNRFVSIATIKDRKVVRWEDYMDSGRQEQRRARSQEAQSALALKDKLLGTNRGVQALAYVARAYTPESQTCRPALAHGLR